MFNLLLSTVEGNISYTMHDMYTKLFPKKHKEKLDKYLESDEWKHTDRVWNYIMNTEDFKYAYNLGEPVYCAIVYADIADQCMHNKIVFIDSNIPSIVTLTGYSEDEVKKAIATKDSIEFLKSNKITVDMAKIVGLISNELYDKDNNTLKSDNEVSEKLKIPVNQVQLVSDFLRRYRIQVSGNDEFIHPITIQQDVNASNTQERKQQPKRQNKRNEQPEVNS